MTQTQEEMLLIGAFGLFWLCEWQPDGDQRWTPHLKFLQKKRS